MMKYEALPSLTSSSSLFILTRAAGASFLLIAAITIGRNVRDSLFLKHFGPANLPYMYAATPLLVVACSYLYGRFVQKLDRLRFLTSSFVFYIGLLALSHALLYVGFRWFYPVFYMVVQAIWALAAMQFWVVAGDAFDVRQARRLFPVLAAGGLLGMVAVGVISGPAVGLIGSANMLLLAMPCLAGALFLLRGIITGAPSAPAPALPKARAAAASTRTATGTSSWAAELRGGARLMRSTPLLNTMAGITLTASIVPVVVDFQFQTAMNSAYPSQDALTSFLGAFRGWAGLGSLAVQLLLTPWLITRFGAGRAVLLYPTLMAAGSLVLLAKYSYGTVLAVKFTDHVMVNALQESALQLLYNPLAPEGRARARAFIEGYLKPVMGGVAGLILAAVLLAGGGPAHLSLVALVFAGLWLLVSGRAGSAYMEELVAGLGGRDVSNRVIAERAFASLKDPQGLERLFSAIRHATPEQAVLAIQFLERFGQPEARALLVRLAEHPQTNIRATAVAALGRLRHPAFDSLVPRLLDDSESRVRANALEALEVTGAGRHRALLDRCLKDPHPRVRANAIRLLARLPDTPPESAAELYETCKRMIRDHEPATCESGLYALGAFSAEQAAPVLLGQLADPAAAPWRQELRSLAEVGDARAVESILTVARISAAARHDAYRAMVQIHARHPQPVMARLLELLRIPERIGLRAEILMVLGRIGDPAALPALAEPLASHDVYVRNRALAGVERLAEQHALPPAVLGAVRSAAREEIEALKTTLSYARSLALHLPHSPARALEQSLREEGGHIQTRIFRAIGILTDRAQAGLIGRRLGPPGAAGNPGRTLRVAGRAGSRAGAFEALEYLAGPELGLPLIAVLEDDDARSSSALPPLRETLAALAAHPAAWIRACTAFVIGHAALAENADLARSARHSSVPMVRQAALYSICRLAARHQEAEALELAQSALSDPHASVRAAAESLVHGRPMLLTVEKVLFLKSVPMFAPLEGDELAHLAEISAEQEAPAGMLVFRENDDAHNLYIIVAGRVRVFRGPAPQPAVLAELGERECFGEMALLDDEPRSATVETLTTCRFLKVRGDDFRDLLLERPRISLEIMRLLTRRLRHMDVEAGATPPAQAGLPDSDAPPVFPTTQEYV